MSFGRYSKKTVSLQIRETTLGHISNENKALLLMQNLRCIFRRSHFGKCMAQMWLLTSGEEIAKKCKNTLGPNPNFYASAVSQNTALSSESKFWILY